VLLILTAAITVIRRENSWRLYITVKSSLQALDLGAGGRIEPFPQGYTCEDKRGANVSWGYPRRTKRGLSLDRLLESAEGTEQALADYLTGEKVAAVPMGNSLKILIADGRSPLPRSCHPVYSTQWWRVPLEGVGSHTT
jgi:hypothetical protein